VKNSKGLFKVTDGGEARAATTDQERPSPPTADLAAWGVHRIATPAIPDEYNRNVPIPIAH